MIVIKKIMSALEGEVARRGFTYFDWNVSSGDVDGAANANEVFAALSSDSFTAHHGVNN